MSSEKNAEAIAMKAQCVVETVERSLISYRRKIITPSDKAD